MSNYYTRRGDDGTTGLLGEGRVPKSHPIPEAVGTIDEASAAIGIARAHSDDPAIIQILLQIQRDLYQLMAEIAATPENAARFRKIDDHRVDWLEQQIEAIGARIEMPREFILPGDTIAGGYFALARTVVRRAERKVAALFYDGNPDNPALLSYLNRLSSLCFLFEIYANHMSGFDSPNLASEPAS
jgi:cob(I)alamin adenosyltransferase